MKVTSLGAMTLPAASMISTSVPTLTADARSIGTSTYASSVSLSSSVVSSVCGVTKSPTRTGMSPIAPATGAVTR